MAAPVITALAYDDVLLAEVPLPGGVLRASVGLGSGLAMRQGDPPGRVWAICDRGPNLKPKQALKSYGLEAARPLLDIEGAKILPLADFTPAIHELQVEGDAIRLLSARPLVGAGGVRLNGLPLPGGPEAAMEPAFGLDGRPLGTSLLGVDTEALAVLADGSFWAGEEYGPSLLRVAADGRVMARCYPAGAEAAWATQAYEVKGPLPADAARRRLNRGVEALALSGDETRLFAILQSPIAGETAARVWTLDAADATPLAEHRYPFDMPESFRRDVADGPVDASDLKIGDALWLDEDRLLVLERISQSSKLYLARLNTDGSIAKSLLLSTDDHPQVCADLEGVALLSDRELLLVNDNDFGIEGAA
ncbi:MAG: esterase-like activity of phytase family protein, partial [Caulobacter sp.]|nr:esterase-like activity of phytase family protein [Caulobacter sp.]